MRYVMLTYFSADAVDRWEAMSPEDQQASVNQHVEWFRDNEGAITGGAELQWPRRTALIRSSGMPVITDGPYPETKEMVGGLILLEADSLEDASQIAASWPSLTDEPNGALVTVTAEQQR